MSCCETESCMQLQRSRAGVEWGPQSSCPQFAYCELVSALYNTETLTVELQANSVYIYVAFSFA